MLTIDALAALNTSASYLRGTMLIMSSTTREPEDCCAQAHKRLDQLAQDGRGVAWRAGPANRAERPRSQGIPAHPVVFGGCRRNS